MKEKGYCDLFLFCISISCGIQNEMEPFSFSVGIFSSL
jgi:hypothetical protein